MARTRTARTRPVRHVAAQERAASTRKGPENDLKRKEKKGNPWKIVAIVFMALFALIIVLSMLRVQQFRNGFTEASEEQRESAQAIAIADLERRGEDTGQLVFSAKDHIRNAGQEGADREIIEVTASGEAQRHTYIIDIGTSDILMYAKTEFYDGIDHRDDARMPPGPPPGPLHEQGSPRG